MNLKIFTLLLFIYLLANVGTSSALSNSGGGEWNYYREIIITENSGKILKDYQFLIKFDSSNFPDNANPDGSDIRFTKSGLELDIWIEKYDADNKIAMIWVKFPEIPSNGNMNIKMYYGNDRASSVSNAKATMKFFDGFDDETYTDKWNGKEGNWIESEGIIKPSDEASFSNFYNAIFVEDITQTDNIIIESKIRGNKVGVAGGMSKTDSIWEFLLNTGDIKSVHIKKNPESMHQFNTSPLYYGINAWTWYIIRTTISGESAKVEILDNNWNLINTVTLMENDIKTIDKIGIISIYNGEWDWFRIRKYASSEPNVSVLAEYIINETPHLILSKSVSTPIILENERALLTITIENKGGKIANNVEIEDTIPNGIEILNAPDLMNLKNIKSGEKQTLEYPIKATNPGKFIFSPAIVTYNDADDRYFSSDSNPIIVQVANVSSNSICAEVPNIEWYNMCRTNISNPSIQQTSDGGYIITGISTFDDVILLKVDEIGNEEWNKTYGGEKKDEGLSVQQTIDKGYIISGYTFSFGSGENDVFLIKTDMYGNEEWSKTFGGSSKDKGYCVQQTIDGGYVISGITQSFGAGENDIYIIKTNMNGNEEWNKSFGGPNLDEGYYVQQTSDGGYIITGKVDVNNFYLLKTDRNGTKDWDKTFEGNCGYSLQQTIDGGYIIVGNSHLIRTRLTDIYLLKTDVDGNEEWNNTFGGPGLDTGYSVQQTFDEGYVITGNDDSNIYILKTDKNGSKEWIRTISDLLGEIHIGRSVQQTSDGGYILASGDSNKIWLVKLSSEVEPSVSSDINKSSKTNNKISGFEIFLSVTGLIVIAYFLKGRSDID